MTDVQTKPRDVIERTWHEQIPLAAAMQIRIADFDGPSLVTRTPLGPNVNLHGTAFAGSLYSIAALTGLGYVWRLGQRLGRPGDIVLTRGEIDYRLPVRGEIVCLANAEDADLQAFAAALEAGRAGRCRVGCRIEFEGRDAVRFFGNYHMRPADCTATVR